MMVVVGSRKTCIFVLRSHTTAIGVMMGDVKTMVTIIWEVAVIGGRTSTVSDTGESTVLPGMPRTAVTNSEAEAEAEVPDLRVQEAIGYPSSQRRK
jgi:hypothetical protein